jgi:hypothetical protein
MAYIVDVVAVARLPFDPRSVWIFCLIVFVELFKATTIAMAITENLGFD